MRSEIYYGWSRGVLGSSSALVFGQKLSCVLHCELLSHGWHLLLEFFIHALVDLLYHLVLVLDVLAGSTDLFELLNDFVHRVSGGLALINGLDPVEKELNWGLSCFHFDVKFVLFKILLLLFVKFINLGLRLFAFKAHYEHKIIKK